MMFRIPKGQNYAWPPVIGFLFHRWMERDVVFDETAQYDFGNEDNEDVNKLFGFGYLNGGHHKDSARFGWNFNNSTNRIRLFAYCYSNGMRIIQEICEVLPHKKVRLSISVHDSKYLFTVHDGYNNWHQIGSTQVGFTHNKKWRYKLSCYFGGNNAAPHEITIKITKK